MESRKFFHKHIITLCFMLFGLHARQQKPAVIFDLSVVVKQDIEGRKKALLKKMQETVRKNYSTMALWKSVRTVFDVPFICNEREVRTEFFKFLAGIHVNGHYPPIVSEGFTFPPIMSAWVLGKLDTNQAQDSANKYIDAQDCSDNDKKFYHAMIYTTFDPTVAHNTRIISPKAEKVLGTCCQNGIKKYLVGHCDPTLKTWLEHEHADLLQKFDKIFFSHQTTVTPDTRFDDGWWLSQLGLSQEPNSYVFVYDLTQDGKKSDAPPHYMSTSKELLRMLA